jgi:hypothetical protein
MACLACPLADLVRFWTDTRTTSPRLGQWLCLPLVYALYVHSLIRHRHLRHDLVGVFPCALVRG